MENKTAETKIDGLSFRGSELERLELCPGSHNAQELIQSAGSAASESGTKVHAGLKDIITMRTLGDALVMSETAEAYAKLKDFTDREAFILSWFSGIVQKVIAERGTGIVEIKKEVATSFPFTTIEGGSIVYGTGSPDLIIRTANAVDVFEYKTGAAEVVTAEKHIQGQTYVVFAADDLSVDAVRLHLLGAGNDKGEQHTFADYNQPEIAHAINRISTVMKNALQPDAPRTVSRKACRYCKAAGTQFCKESCHAVASFSDKIVKMTDPVAVFLALAPDQRTATLDRINTVKPILDKILKSAKEGLQADAGFIPSYKIGEGRTMREIPDARAAFKILNESVGITPGQFSQIVSVGIGDIKKLYVEHAEAKAKSLNEKPPAKKAMEAAAMDLLKPVIEIKQAAGSLERIEA